MYIEDEHGWDDEYYARRCDNDYSDIHNTLRSRGFDPAQPLFVSANWGGSEPSDTARTLAAIEGAGYRIVKAPGAQGGCCL